MCRVTHTSSTSSLLHERPSLNARGGRFDIQHVMSDDLNELQRAVGRIEGKLDEALKNATGSEARQNRLGARVSKLEQWRSWTLGATAMLFLLLGALWRIAGVHG